MLAKFRSEVVTNIPYIFKDENDVVDSIVRRTVIVVSVGKMLKES
jgi:hypothetical protein